MGSCQTFLRYFIASDIDPNGVRQIILEGTTYQLALPNAQSKRHLEG